MSTVERSVTQPPETRIVINDIPWSTYLDLSSQRRGSVPRMTYDEGVLELMSPQRKHENIGCLIGRMIEAYSEELEIEVLSLASTTVRSSELKKAFEADESYYVTHARRLLEKEELDFEVDPPPDLVIEVEITASAIQKMNLFARMGVPEVWRHDGKGLQMFRLMDGEYQLIASSVELPGLSCSMIQETLNLRTQVGETTLIKQFRKKISAS